jgi:hypothetical protein
MQAEADISVKDIIDDSGVLQTPPFYACGRKMLIATFIYSSKI